MQLSRARFLSTASTIHQGASGMWAPKGTPKDVIAKVNAAVSAAFADPAVRKRFADLGHEIPPRDALTPQALFDYHKAELDRWWPIIKAAGIKPE